MKKAINPKLGEFYIWEKSPKERVTVQVTSINKDDNIASMNVVDMPNIPAELPADSGLIPLHVTGNHTWGMTYDLYELDESIDPKNVYDVTYVSYHDAKTNNGRYIKLRDARVIAPSQECAILRIMGRIAAHRKALGYEVESKFDSYRQWISMKLKSDDHIFVDFYDCFRAHNPYNYDIKTIQRTKVEDKQC